MNGSIATLIEKFDELPLVRPMSKKHNCDPWAQKKEKKIGCSEAYSQVYSIMNGRKYEKVSKSLSKRLSNCSHESRINVLSAIQDKLEKLLQENPRQFYEMMKLKQEYPEIMTEFDASHLDITRGTGLNWGVGTDRNKCYAQLLSEAIEERYRNIARAISEYTNKAVGEEKIRFDFYDAKGRREAYIEYPNAKKAKLSANDMTKNTRRIDLNVFNEEKGNYSIRFELRDEYTYKTSKETIIECNGEKALKIREQNPLKELYITPVMIK